MLSSIFAIVFVHIIFICNIVIANVYMYRRRLHKFTTCVWPLARWANKNWNTIIYSIFTFIFRFGLKGKSYKTDDEDAADTQTFSLPHTSTLYSHI